MSFLDARFVVPSYEGPALKHRRVVDVKDKPAAAVAIEVPQELARPVVSSDDVREVVISIVVHLFGLIGIGEERSEASGDEDVADMAASREEALRIFNCQEAPTIELGDYVWRLVRYTDAWAGTDGVGGAGLRCALMAVEYLDRAASNGVYLTLNNVHRLFMVAVLEAAKWSEDVIISNAFFAQVAGIELHELNAIEAVFCSEVLDWKLSVSRDRLREQGSRFAQPQF